MGLLTLVVSDFYAWDILDQILKFGVAVVSDAEVWVIVFDFLG